VAARLLGAAHSVRAGVGANVMPFHDHLMARARESATAALGAARFAADDSHVRSILNKLGVSTRAQIAAWMSAPGQ
jgi:hypothetical protein